MQGGEPGGCHSTRAFSFANTLGILKHVRRQPYRRSYSLALAQQVAWQRMSLGSRITANRSLVNKVLPRPASRCPGDDVGLSRGHSEISKHLADRIDLIYA